MGNPRKRKKARILELLKQTQEAGKDIKYTEEFIVSEPVKVEEVVVEEKPVEEVKSTKKKKIV